MERVPILKIGTTLFVVRLGRGLAASLALEQQDQVRVATALSAPEEVLTDEVALTSILRNLLSNGIKYTDHGEVRLSAQVTSPRLEISVADTGIGTPAGLHEHAFEEFYQVPGARRGGTGPALGMPREDDIAMIALRRTGTGPGTWGRTQT